MGKRMGRSGRRAGAGHVAAEEAAGIGAATATVTLPGTMPPLTMGTLLVMQMNPNTRPVRHAPATTQEKV